MPFLTFFASAISVPCPIDRATYVQRGSEIMIRFQPVASGSKWPSHLAAKISFGNSRPSQWFLAWHGGSSGGEFLSSTTDINTAGWHAPDPDDAAERRRDDVLVIAADAGYAVRREALAVGTPAPAYLLIPSMRELAWYGPDETERAQESGQFFDLTECDDQLVSSGG